MPNPLTVMTSSPTATARTQTTTPETGEDKGTAFQAFLNQDSGTKEEEVIEVQEPEPDAEAELEELPSPGDLDEQIEEVLTGEYPPKRPIAEQVRPVGGMQPPTAISGPDPMGNNANETEAKTQSDGITAPVVKAESAPSTMHPSEISGALQETRPPTKLDQAATAPQPSELRSKDIANLKSLPEPAPNDAQTRSTPSLTTPPNAGLNRAPSIAQMQLLASDKNNMQTDKASVQDVEDTQLFRSESPVLASRETASASTFTIQTARAETARAVAGQMAAVINAQPNSKAVEIALNPEELGRVSMVLNGRDDGIHLTISAERPETLDLMRRHLSVLAEEFHAFGLGDLSIDLETSADAQHGQSEQEPAPKTDNAQSAETPTPASPLPRIGHTGRIDMRL